MCMCTEYVQSVVPDLSIAQNTAVTVSRKTHRQQKTAGSRGCAVQRSNCYDNRLKPSSLGVTPSCRSSFGGHSSTPTMPDASEDSLFLSDIGPDLSAIGPAPQHCKLIQLCYVAVVVFCFIY